MVNTIKDLRALTVLQPFASLIAEGEKTIELRCWPTKYRGLLAICSGAKELANTRLTSFGWAVFTPGPAGDELRLGRALSLVRLVDCRPAKWGPGSDDFDAACVSVEGYRKWIFEKQGSVRPVYAWVLERVCPLDLPVRGKQGLWKPGDALLMHASEKYLAYALGAPSPDVSELAP